MSGAITTREMLKAFPPPLSLLNAMSNHASALPGNSYAGASMALLHEIAAYAIEVTKAYEAAEAPQ